MAMLPPAGTMTVPEMSPDATPLTEMTVTVPPVTVTATGWPVLLAVCTVLAGTEGATSGWAGLGSTRMPVTVPPVTATETFWPVLLAWATVVAGTAGVVTAIGCSSLREDWFGVGVTGLLRRGERDQVGRPVGRFQRAACRDVHDGPGRHVERHAVPGDRDVGLDHPAVRCHRGLPQLARAWWPTSSVPWVKARRLPAPIAVYSGPAGSRTIAVPAR